MNKSMIRYSVIAGVFIAAIIFFSVFMNQGNTDMTMDMSGATLPVASILFDNTKMNEMHGYLEKMELGTMRDSITPLRDNRQLTFEIDKYGQEITGIKYEVRSADGERLIEDTEVYNYEEDRNTIRASVNLKDLIEENTEYNFVLIITMNDGRTVYYYTRIIQKQDAGVLEKIEFVLDFHDKTFDKNEVKELSTYMEPNAEEDNTTFGRVTIHSSMNQLSWGNMNVTPVTEPVLTICELGDQTASITLDYSVQIQEGKITNQYRIHEYYRIRSATNRFYLLSYERTMDEYFTMDKTSFANNKIVLGIENTATQMMESDGGNILAFSNGGRVFSYNVSENKFARLFAFYDQDNFDSRTYYRQADVKILNVEENGNVTFMVYGYMNRGMHEGEAGVEICYYSSMLNTIEEQIFIQYTKSPDILMEDMKKLSYVNRSNKLFALIDGSIYAIDINQFTYREIVSGLDEESYQVSASNEMLVWQKEKQLQNSRTLVLMNLNTEKTTEISAKSGEYIRPLGFLNEDLIYGVANETDIASNTLGIVTFPMKKVMIESEDGSILKNYHVENIYVTDGIIEGNQITLNRVKKTDDMLSYEETTNDQITSNIEEATGVNHIAEAVTDLYETIAQIELKNEIDTRTLKFLTPKVVIYEGRRILAIEQNEMQERFLVYVGGTVIEACTDASKAVKMAYDNMGTVIDYRGNEIYRRGELSSRNQIMAIKEDSITDEKGTMAVCLDTILKYEGISRNTEYMLQNGTSAYQILSDNLKDDYILNLTGCGTDVMLYYVNKDIPVLASLNDGSAVLLIGFNEQNTVLMDPQTGTIYKKGINDSRTMFEENGNQFITYVKVENTPQE